MQNKVKSPHATLYPEDTGKPGQNLGNFISGFPGIVTYGFAANPTLNEPLLIVVDGRPIDRNSSRSVPSHIALMDVSNVERVEHLGPPASFFWGPKGANGVLEIYTKKGAGSELKLLSPEFDIAGHVTEREFYSPNYSIKLEKDRSLDHRPTLYWNPSCKTDSNGNAKFAFYNSDIAEQLELVIEGLSEYGAPGTYIKTFGPKD